MDNSIKKQQLDIPHALNTIQYLVEHNLIQDAIDFEKKIRKENPEQLESIGSFKTEIELRKFITVHPAMLSLKDDVRKLASIADAVLIIGESGTGKELLARALHGNREGKFVAVNCTSLPDYLMESELFGHVRGAFTGAVEDKIGLFQYASRGTILLDEIGDMPCELQAKLLRVLQDYRGRRVGSNEEYEISARVVCSTNKDLKSINFRQDLYYRISTFILETLPLRDRCDDVALIIKSLDKEHKFPSIAEWWNKYLESSKGPFLAGNIRELQQIVRRYLVLNKI